MRYLALALTLVACTQPGTPTVVEGSPASAEVLGVAMHSVRVYVVKDTKRDMTCWVAVTNTGGSVAIDCEDEHAVIVAPPQPAATATPPKVVPVPAADPKLPTLPPMPGEVK